MDLERKIEKQRSVLENKIDDHLNLSNEKVVAESRKLDLIINKYMKQSK